MMGPRLGRRAEDQQRKRRDEITLHANDPPAVFGPANYSTASRTIARTVRKMIYAARPVREGALRPMGREMLRIVPLALAFVIVSMPASAQVDLTGSWAPRLYEDYIERGPGSDLGDFTGMPMNDEGRAKALLYTSNQPSTVERQCLPQAPWVMQYRPRGISIWAEEDRDGQVIAWKLGGDYLRDTVTIWMD